MTDSSCDVGSGAGMEQRTPGAFEDFRLDAQERALLAEAAGDAARLARLIDDGLAALQADRAQDAQDPR